MPRNVKNKEAGKLVSFVQEEVEMGIRQWWQELKKEKKRKELVKSAQTLEAKVDPSLPKKRLPENRAVKQFRKGTPSCNFIFQIGPNFKLFLKNTRKSLDMGRISQYTSHSYEVTNNF